MEVLSIGEKIKRARIYKGYTLKEVCGNKISVSKLSCIENNKILPEDYILEYIASRLGIDLEYLNESIEDQINNNIKQAIKDKKDIIKKLKYNLNLARKYKYYDLAFDIIHMIFDYLLKNNELVMAEQLIGDYYDFCNNSSEKSKRFLYYMHVAEFFYKNKEFYQASNYFSNVRNGILSQSKKDYVALAYSTYGEAMSRIMLGDYDNAFEVSKDLNRFTRYVKDKIKKSKMYHMMAILSLKFNDGKFEEYKRKSFKFCEDNYTYKADFILDYAYLMFQINLKDQALSYIKEALDIYPKCNEKELVKFMLKCVECLIENEIIDFADKLSEEVLNRSISIEDIKFIEKSYYLKSKILQRRGNLSSTEMYMNLSLDTLTKFGTKKEVYKRYMEMGKMYYDMNYINESLKYFTLAISIEKKL